MGVPVIRHHPVVARFATDSNTPVLHSCLSQRAYSIFHDDSDVVDEDELAGGLTCIDGCERASASSQSQIEAAVVPNTVNCNFYILVKNFLTWQPSQNRAVTDSGQAEAAAVPNAVNCIFYA